MITLILREIAQNGQITEYALDTANTLQLSPGSSYTLIDQATDQPAEGLTLARNGDNLEIQLDGDLVATLNGFYVDGANISFSDGANLLASSADLEGEAVWEVAGQASSVVPDGAALAGLIVAGWALVADSGSEFVAPQTVTVAAAAGPFITTMGVEIYGSDGTLLAELEHDFSTGPVPVDIDGSYSGALLIKVIDINGDGVDYLDETTGENVSLGSQTLRAMASTDDSEVSVTPLTELAARLAGITDNNAVTEGQVATNDQVADLFGLTDILGDVTTVVDDDFDSIDGINAAEGYGQVLAVLSGADSVSGSVDDTLDAIVDAISETDGTLELDEAAVELIADGFDAFVDGENGDTIDEEAVDDVIPGLVDTTAPTTSISAIALSDDSGSSDEDFLTNSAAQTISATLSAALEAGEVLYGSTDGGATFDDITTSVSGTAISWETSLTGAEIQFYVADAAGNEGAVATQAYVLDTTAPVIGSVEVAPDGSVVVTFGEELAGLSAEDFSLTVNGAELSFTAISVVGAVVTLTPAQTIYSDDVVSALATTAVDAAGNAATTATSITNNAVAVNLEFSKAYSALTTEELTGIDQTGLSGNDLLAVNIYSGDNDTGIYNLDIDQTGGDGDDVINATLDGQFVGDTTESAYNAVIQDGDAGDDALSVNLKALATVVDEYTTTSEGSVFTNTGVFAGIISNNVEMQGGTGIDSLALNVFASGSASDFAGDGVNAFVEYNGFTLEGGNDNDALTVAISALADNNGTSEAAASAAFLNNNLGIYGGTGVDTANVDLTAVALASSGANAYVGSSSSWGDTAGNIITASAENLDINLMAFAGVSADQTSATTAERARAGIQGNNVLVNPETSPVMIEGIADIDINMAAYALGKTGADASVWGNGVGIYGGASDDDISVVMSAEATVTTALDAEFSASAFVGSNAVTVQAGGGNDLISVQMDVYGDDARANIGGNELYLRGDDGVDTINIDLTAVAFGSSVSAYVGSEGDSLINASAENLDINLMAFAGVSADQTSPTAIAEGARAFVQSNNIDINADTSPEGMANIGVNLGAYALATSAIAQIGANEIDIYGGDSTDLISVALTASASWDSEGEGQALIVENTIDIDAGAGADTINVTLDAKGNGAEGSVGGNIVIIDGGAGSDTINLDVMGEENAYVFRYDDASDFGDTIVGLDQAFAGSNDIIFEFGASFASAAVFSSAAATEGSTAAFYYDTFGTSSFALYYDSDGSGSVAASAVAIFATDIGGTSNFDIYSTGSPF